MIYCPLCNEKSDLIWREKKYKTYRCSKCSVVFLHPLPNNPVALYDEEYFRKWYLKYYAERRAYLSGLFSRIETHTGKAGKLLDVGCGTGILMDIAKGRGWDVCGQDVSPFAVEHCRAKGFEVYDKPLPELSFPGKFFDLITMFDVVAHLEDPVAYVQSCERLLRPGGYLVIKTPYHPPYLFLAANIFSFTGRSRSLLHVPAQIFHCSKGALLEFSAKSGFENAVFSTAREFAVMKMYNFKTFAINLLKIFLSGRTMLAILRKRDE